MKSYAYDMARPRALTANTRVLPTLPPHFDHQLEVNALRIPAVTRRPIWSFAAAAWTAGSWKQYWGTPPKVGFLGIRNASSVAYTRVEFDDSGSSVGNIECSTLAAQVS
jgi:hypothetical protein